LGSYGSVFAIESLLIDDRPCVAFEGLQPSDRPLGFDEGCPNPAAFRRP
jgi:hypothetical protein